MFKYLELIYEKKIGTLTILNIIGLKKKRILNTGKSTNIVFLFPNNFYSTTKRFSDDSLFSTTIEDG